MMLSKTMLKRTGDGGTLTDVYSRVTERGRGGNFKLVNDDADDDDDDNDDDEYDYKRLQFAIDGQHLSRRWRGPEVLHISVCSCQGNACCNFRPGLSSFLLLCSRSSTVSSPMKTFLCISNVDQNPHGLVFNQPTHHRHHHHLKIKLTKYRIHKKLTL